MKEKKKDMVREEREGWREGEGGKGRKRKIGAERRQRKKVRGEWARKRGEGPER